MTTSPPRPVQQIPCYDHGPAVVVGPGGATPSEVAPHPAVYYVTHWSDGAWTCTCGEVRAAGGDCRHRKALRARTMFG